MKKKNNLLIIFIILLIPSISMASSGWEEGYINFVEDPNNYRNNFTYNIDPLRCFLFDMDKDGIPELIIHTIDESNYSYNIYTYRDNRVKRIYGEMTVEGYTYFSLREDGDRLFKVSEDSDGTYYEEVGKRKNRIVFDQLASKTVHVSRTFYKDKEEVEITEGRYNRIIDSIKINSFNLENISDNIEEFKEANRDVIDIKLNGDNLPKDTPIINRDGSNYYPFRALIEGAGGRAVWDGDRRQALGFLDKNEIAFPIDLSIYELNGIEKVLPEDRMTFLYRDRTYIPIRNVMEDLGFKVFWNSKDNTIELIK